MLVVTLSSTHTSFLALCSSHVCLEMSDVSPRPHRFLLRSSRFLIFYAFQACSAQPKLVLCICSYEEYAGYVGMYIHKNMLLLTLQNEVKQLLKRWEKNLPSSKIDVSYTPVLIALTNLLDSVLLMRLTSCRGLSRLRLDQ